MAWRCGRDTVAAPRRRTVCADPAIEATSTEKPPRRILTPDQRLRVFISSTLQELAPERLAAQGAVSKLRLTPVLFEIGARPHPPQDLYRAYLEQSQVFVGIYWQSYGWVAPGDEVSGIEDEYLRSAGMPRLVYVKEPVTDREPRLSAFLDRLRADAGVSYKKFATAEELAELVSQDLALLITERFASPPAHMEGVHLRPLPAQSTSFVGRTGELDEIVRLLGKREARLLTLTGPGGIGKTRLAIEAARELASSFPAGVAFVPLEGLGSAELVGGTIASALGVRDIGPDPASTLLPYLRSRSLLLVLDNFEHVVAAAPLVAALLEEAPELAILVTSREPLRLRAEHEWRVAPLPADGAAALLFAERAAAVLHGLALPPADAPIVSAICRRLDGLPLAIELAAPRLRLISAEQLLESLSEPFALAAARDAPTRQRTLEDAIAWSYELLEPRERTVFERLSVFRGSFTVEAAAAVCDTSTSDILATLASLLDKSLVQRLIDERETRFSMLTTIRDFARRRLEDSPYAASVAEAETRYYLALAACTEAGLRSAEQRAWKHLVDLEADTFRLVLDRLSEQGRSHELVTILRGLWLWYWLTAQLNEGRAWTNRALAQIGDLSVEERAWTLFLDSMFAFFRMELEHSKAAAAEARALFQQAGDKLGYATSLTVGAFAAGSLGEAVALEQLDEAAAVFEEAGDAWGAAGAVSSICRIRSIFGDYEDRGDLFQRGLTTAERAGDDLLISLALTNLADYSLAVGDVAASRRYAQRSLALLAATGVHYAAPDTLEALTRSEARDGDPATAAELAGTAQALRDVMGVPLWGPIAARQQAVIESLRGRLGEEAFDDAFDRGRSIQLEHWVAGARGEGARIVVS
jgi:predicted ATPase